MPGKGRGSRGAAKRFRKIHSVKEYTGFHRGRTQWRVVERSGDKRSERERATGQDKDRERERETETRGELAASVFAPSTCFE